ncbi:unnamed protein product [Euphydryas editha]|uniref:protein-serine/threonine phosphatase n=1 Tax=Euphydryas editha TaxID=104508 RepID=A0AAU9UC64_EUPED|nr:unnamed protein product [Euphydryas editha]
MDKEKNRSAAGLRRSAIAERLRLREEWSALKGTSDKTNRQQNKKNVLTNKSQNLVISFPKNVGTMSKYKTRKNDKSDFPVSEVLCGNVVLVDVGSETRALPLRAALTALGATVVPTWSPLVTHLVWSQGGCKSLRAKARALACRLVSPLWVEACATTGRRLPEKLFPAPTRPSDLPSPTTLKILLKKADQENIPLQNLLSDSTESEKGKPTRLRISSETDHDTTNTTDTSHDTSYDKSKDKSHDESKDKSHDKSDKTISPDPETRVNTAPRRALPISITPQRPTKSKRKLFTQKEAEVNTDDESDKETPEVQTKVKPKLTERGRRELVHAERIARKLMGTPKHTQMDKSVSRQYNDKVPRIVLTGMSKQERHEIWEAIRKLNGKVQNNVNKKTTHVLMGSCTDTDKQTNMQNKNKHIVMCQKCNSPEVILSQMFINNVTVRDQSHENEDIVCSCNDISGIKSVAVSKNKNINKENVPPNHTNERSDNTNENINNSLQIVTNDKPRTVNALLGAVRGCRVLYAQFARDSLKAKRWLHHFGYEVPHLKKISQKARVERLALGKMRSEYAYDIFNGMRVKVSDNAEQKDAVKQLLTLCGAITQDTNMVGQNGARKQNGGHVTADFDVTIGRATGEVSSKWVFDSVVAARMRTTRRYINKDV